MVDENTLFESIPYHSTIFKNLRAPEVKRAALKTHGRNGPSGLDANGWKQIFTCLKKISANIAKTLAKSAVCLANGSILKISRSVQRTQANPLKQRPG